MNRKILAWVLAPTPVIVVLLIPCLMVLLSPNELVNGEVDNDPYRAAMLLLLLIPVVFYPSSLILFAVHLFIAGRLKGNIKRNLIISLLLVSVILSMIIAKGFYQPQFGESYLLTSLIFFCITSLLLAFMTLTWKVVRGGLGSK